jgi:hypothetical protein
VLDQSPNGASASPARTSAAAKLTFEARRGTKFKTCLHFRSNQEQKSSNPLDNFANLRRRHTKFDALNQSIFFAKQAERRSKKMELLKTMQEQARANQVQISRQYRKGTCPGLLRSLIRRSRLLTKLYGITR